MGMGHCCFGVSPCFETNQGIPFPMGVELLEPEQPKVSAVTLVTKPSSSTYFALTRSSWSCRRTMRTCINISIIYIYMYNVISKMFIV